MRTIGLSILTSIVAGCAASSEHRAVAPAPPPPQQTIVAPRPATPVVPEHPVVQVPHPPATAPAIPPTTAPTVAATPSAPPPRPKPALPPDYRQYLLQTTGNWWLRVDRDGGGAYGYGNSNEDRATFGAGTFDFLKLGQTLREKMSAGDSLTKGTAVTLSPRKGIPTQGVLADGRYVRSLFDTAKSHRQGDLAQLDHLEATFPVLPEQSGQH